VFPMNWLELNRFQYSNKPSTGSNHSPRTLTLSDQSAASISGSEISVVKDPLLSQLISSPVIGTKI
jgi:hypothetical protein